MRCNLKIYRKGIVVGMAASLLLHVSGLAWLASGDRTPLPVVVETLLVGFVPSTQAAPVPQSVSEKNTPILRPESKPVVRSMSGPTVRKVALSSAAESGSSRDSAAAIIEAPAENAARPLRSMMPHTESSIVCPEQSAPAYPPMSRRLGEEGVVMLRVELDEKGKVSNVQVATSSGYTRLDEAARVTVSAWRCSPALRNGQPVATIAMQPFKFMLNGN